jgi:DNA invertase Pin-like site-specific DNA recombinase
MEKTIRLSWKGGFMRQSKNKKTRDVTAFIYPRLSRDDNLDGESYSISNQKKLLTKAAKDMGYTNILTFVDDGVSGVTMDRPGFNEMMKQLEEGKASAVFVKDLSRLGRNYIEVGRLMDEFFPEHDIRLVAVSDGIDTAEGENELAPIRNLFNEWYARDISKKRRISNKIKGNAGEPMGQPPYGYIKDPDNPKRWIVDEKAAQVVRRIYSMTMEGYGTTQIASKLESENILTPNAYWLQKGINRSGRNKQLPPTHWNASTVIKILSLQEYCGDILNFKTYSKSYKNKKRIENDRENWVVFQDVHEPIIDRAVWEQVQQKRGKIRKRCTHEGERNMFSGLLVCADCGCNLHYHFNQKNHDIKYFNCSNYKGNRGTCDSTHYVRVDFLEQVVLGEIRRLTKFATQYEDLFTQAIMGHSQQNVELNRKLKEKELKTLQARDEELDGLFERIYEDNVSGKLSDDRFAKMSRRYEQEQKELAEKIKVVRAELEKQSSKSMTTDMFVATVRKYTRAKKLTPRMLNELIEKIEVHQAEKIDGVWEQRLVIHYNCVGTIFIPEVLPLPAPEVSVNTRKGVVVNYAPDPVAL